MSAPRPLSREMMEQLLEGLGDGPAALRNRALLAVLYRLGLRSREATTLEAIDVDRARAGWRVRVSHPKGEARGAQHRIIGVDARSQQYLEAWWQVRLRDHELVFHTRTGEPVQTSYLRQLLPRLARKQGVRRRVHPHALRHTFARELYEEGAGVLEIMGALGHTRIATTQLYLRSIGATEVVKLTQGRVW